jgi:hypothetical protein
MPPQESPLLLPHGPAGRKTTSRRLLTEASGFLVGPSVFNTVVGAQARWRVRFPSASATRNPELLRLRAGQQHAVVQRVEESSVADPLPAFDELVGMIAICPVGPPKLMNPSLIQKSQSQGRPACPSEASKLTRVTGATYAELRLCAKQMHLPRRGRLGPAMAVLAKLTPSYALRAEAR